MKWQSSWFVISNGDETILDPTYPTPKILCRVGSAYNRATCFKLDQQLSNVNLKWNENVADTSYVAIKWNESDFKVYEAKRWCAAT